MDRALTVPTPLNPERERLVQPLNPPPELAAAVQGRIWVRDLVGEAGGAVHRLIGGPSEADLYLKHGHGAAARDITDEMVRLRWLAHHVRTPQVVHFTATEDEARLLTTALPGRTAYDRMTADPSSAPEVVDHLAAFLKQLHAIPLDRCPFDSGAALRMRLAHDRMEAGLVETEDFDETRQGWTAQQVWDQITALRPADDDRVVTHGDYSLDNILIADDGGVGCIDVGRAGSADRYQDIAIVWSNLAEFGANLQARFLTAYGIAAPDQARLQFHLGLDEFF